MSSPGIPESLRRDSTTGPSIGVTVVGGEVGIDATGLATSAKQDTLLTELQLKADLTETQPVSLATVPSHAVTNAGTFVVQASITGGALTSLQLLDDVILVLGTSTYTEATTKGTILAAIRRDADTTLVNTTNEVSPLQVDANGRLKVEVFSGETLPVSGALTSTNETVATATLANVSASATSVTALASAAGRKAAYFFNDSSSFAYLKFGATASATSFTIKVDPFGFYEVPQPVYTGIIDMIHDTATGTMRVTSM